MRAQGRKGVVIMITLGTGIGSAVFVDGMLVPNTELGHLEIDGKDAETQASGSARDRERPVPQGVRQAPQPLPQRTSTRCSGPTSSSSAAA